MNLENDEGDDGEYGMDSSTNTIHPLTERELKYIEYIRRKKANEAKTSYDFNRYLINLYNEARKK